MAKIIPRYYKKYFKFLKYNGGHIDIQTFVLYNLIITQERMFVNAKGDAHE